MKTFDLKQAENLFQVPTDNPELIRAQFTALSKQIPLLYLILASNSLAIAYTFASQAPLWLAVYIPLALCSLCAVRLVWWWQHRHHKFSDSETLKILQITNKLAATIAVGFTTWGLNLYRYGDPYAQGQVAFYMALTVIGCIFCLMHLRSAALSVTLLVNIPFILFFSMQEQHSLRAIAVNLALVSTAMIIILFIYYRDFAQLVESRKTLMVKQAETQALSDENFRIANLDSLTELPNRRRFFAELDRHFDQAQATGTSFSVGIIDLDGFKPINDTYGHITGDRVLTEVGQRLIEACQDAAIVARLGGDEFGFIISGQHESDALQALGRTISTALSRPYPIGSSHALLGSSIGVASYPDSANTPQTLFERADYALYYAKRHLRGQMVRFTAEHEAQIRSHGVIEQALQTADLEAELTLNFQPIIDITTGRAVAFEALARWQSPTLGTISPSSFITVAERSGQIHSLTKVLLKKALAALASWPEHIRISFNLSAHDISSAEGVIQIIALINASGVNPKRIDFEITETSIAYDFQQARAAVLAFKALGVGISLDDFGTGYSSLSHVHRLPLTKIKVDRSFITDINTNAISHKIVKSLTALCADMGLTCIIEGVETSEQLDKLTEMGCSMIQGYHFAKPMSGDLVHSFLRDEDQRLKSA